MSRGRVATLSTRWTRNHRIVSIWISSLAKGLLYRCLYHPIAISHHILSLSLQTSFDVSQHFIFLGLFSLTAPVTIDMLWKTKFPIYYANSLCATHVLCNTYIFGCI